MVPGMLIRQDDCFWLLVGCVDTYLLHLINIVFPFLYLEFMLSIFVPSVSLVIFTISQLKIVKFAGKCLPLCYFTLG
jgi:hypothetical protein